jgi:glycosyltransferase involved in cell wall biosynthesis
MKILYDHQAFTTQDFGGISRYFWELICYFSTLDTIEVNLPIFFTNNIYLKEEVVPHYKLFPKYKIKGKVKFIRFINHYYSHHRISKLDYDILHPTNYNDYHLAINNKPFVITIHDMIHENYGKTYPELYNEKLLKLKKSLASKASRIIAVSENTKKDILKFYDHIDESKIEVIYHGNSIDEDEELSTNIKVPDNYLLYVGTRKHYKNFFFFLRACKQFIEKNKDFKVVLAGGGILLKPEVDYINDLGLKNQVIHYHKVSDSELHLIYKKAFAFIFPSLYEGFGIPVLEGFNMKVPVLISNATALPEVGKDAALQFDPTKEDDLVDKLEQVKDASLRESLIKKGIDRAKLFTWEKTAEQTLKVYKSAI